MKGLGFCAEKFGIFSGRRVVRLDFHIIVIVQTMV